VVDPAGGGTATGTATGTAALELSIVDGLVGADCMPPPSVDPLSAWFTMRYDNSLGTAQGQAVITACTVYLGGPPASASYSIDIDPAASGEVAAGAVVDVDHIKVADSAVGVAHPCGLCGSPSALFDVEVQVDGGPAQTVSASFDFGCAY